MKEQEMIERYQGLAREWFKDHVATQNHYGQDALGADVRVINWRRPNTSNYAVRFILIGGYVLVTGDVGEAVYGFGCPVTFDFLAQCDWHYFINKCCASETGRDYTMKIPGVKSPVPNVRAIAHYVGLLAAIKQLT